MNFMVTALEATTARYLLRVSETGWWHPGCPLCLGSTQGLRRCTVRTDAGHLGRLFLALLPADVVDAGLYIHYISDTDSQVVR